MDSSLTHRFVDVNGVRLHIAEQGQGPLVLLLHGWPESWYSWRHQFGALAAAGYRVVAPDQRGYARSPMSAAAPQLHGPVVLPGCGHWTQQERPAEVNAALLDFLARIDGS